MNEQTIKGIQDAAMAVQRHLHSDSAEEHMLMLRSAHGVAKERLLAAKAAGRDETTLADLRLKLSRTSAELSVEASLQNALAFLDRAIEELREARGAAHDVQRALAGQAEFQANLEAAMEAARNSQGQTRRLAPRGGGPPGQTLERTGEAGPASC